MISVTTRRTPTVWPVVAVVSVAGVLWAWAAQRGLHTARFPAAPLSLVTFLAVQVAIPRARWHRDRALGPGNVALMLFAVQLVVLPIVLVISGPAPGTMRIIPPDRYINAALLLQALAYASFAAGYVAWKSPVRTRGLLPQPNITAAVALTFIVMGASGLALAFPSPSALLDYFTGQGDVFEDAGPTSLRDAAGIFLRPFLAYGLIILWSARIARRRPGRRLSLGEFGLAALAVAASATYGYNRASAVIPILALITAYNYFGRRQTPARLVAVLLILVTLGFQFGQYRTEYTGTEGGRINATDAGLNRPKEGFTDTLQVYGSGPQFWALVVEDVERSGLREGETMIGSVLLPVPVLGKPFRAQSGPTVYNELVYGSTEAADQILGYGAELYWNFGLAGLVVGYALLGLLIRRFDDMMESAIDPLAVYSWSFCGVWVAMLTVNSLSILTQIIAYFFWPVVVIAVLARLAPPRAAGVQA